MLNTYPLWKYLLIVGVLVLGGLFAAPNLFPPDFAIQVAPEGSDAELPAGVVRRAVRALDEAEIDYFGAQQDGRSFLLRVRTNEEQILAREVIQEALGDDYVAALNLAPTTPDWLASMGASPMKYGLDLSGGVHFLLEVDMAKAVADRLSALEDDLKGLLRESRIRYQDMHFDEEGNLSVAFGGAEARNAARTLVRERFPEFVPQSQDLNGRPGLVLAMPAETRRDIEAYAISQNLQSLRKRVNELGVSEALVQSLGNARIVVDLPGVQDSTRAKIILGKVANLEFRLVAAPDARGSETESYEYEGRPELLERRNIVTGDRVANALHDYDPQTNMPQVSITLDGQGGDAMHRATRYNIGRKMAILFRETKTRQVKVIENGEEVMKRQPYETKRLISVATIQAALGSRFRITGLSQGEARDLSLLLRAGALAAPMYIVEERTVGASLGEDNIERGFNSIVIGFTCVLLFMLVYYKIFGIAANIALTVNLVLLVAMMSMIGATLTLPGIAGIVLTVGMAVDANVLIFSRIKEELRERPPQQAIHSGFERAIVTILDANVTTFIVAVILYAIGTGPVKGFAVTLMVGILTSMFTAILGTRALVNLMYGGRNVERLAI